MPNRTNGQEFRIGEDQFSNLEVNSSPSNGNYYYFKDINTQQRVTRFILKESPRTRKICEVKLIKSDDRFTPRLHITIRNASSQIVEEEILTPQSVRASVDLDDCQNEFWELINFLLSIREIEIPLYPFTVASQEDRDILEELRNLDQSSLSNVMQALAYAPGVTITSRDINTLLKTRQKLIEFEQALQDHDTDESWWQTFFEDNKWIFGYGLKYEILRHEQSQPGYGGGRLDGQGSQQGDFLLSTSGNVSFTVLVEIKTPSTKLIRGTNPIRNGAWSLSRELTDALSQIQANIHTWEMQGSRQPDNQDRLENLNIYTVRPKGIMVIGNLGDLGIDRHKRETFQRFRNSIHGVEIITFDELYERAKYIVEND